MKPVLPDNDLINSSIIKRLLEETKIKLGMTPSELKALEAKMKQQLQKQASDSFNVRIWLEVYESEAEFKPLTPELLKEARLHLGLTGQELAIVCGFKKTEHAYKQLQACERGERPITDFLSRIVRAFLTNHRPPDWPKPDH